MSASCPQNGRELPKGGGVLRVATDQGRSYRRLTSRRPVMICALSTNDTDNIVVAHSDSSHEPILPCGVEESHSLCADFLGRLDTFICERAVREDPVLNRL